MEIGLDKAGITHLKHSESMRENFSDITDGWYSYTESSLFYGFQGSKTIVRNFDLTLRVGSTNSVSTEQDPLLPVYTQIGLVWKISKKKE